MGALPIPAAALPHSATHKYGTPSGDSSWTGGETWPSSRTLGAVRFERVAETVRDQNNVEVKLSGLLFYDCATSTPSGVTFALGDGIMIDGQLFRVAVLGVEYADGAAPHHYEIGLI